MLQSGWNAISVRLGEIDLRTALDCEDVSENIRLKKCDYTNYVLPCESWIICIHRNNALIILSIYHFLRYLFMKIMTQHQCYQRMTSHWFAWCNRFHLHNGFGRFVCHLRHIWRIVILTKWFSPLLVLVELKMVNQLITVIDQFYES